MTLPSLVSAGADSPPGGCSQARPTVHTIAAISSNGVICNRKYYLCKVWPPFFQYNITDVFCAKKRLGHACICPTMVTGEPVLKLYPPPSKSWLFCGQKMKIPHMNSCYCLLLSLEKKSDQSCVFFGGGGQRIAKSTTPDRLRIAMGYPNSRC